MEDLYAVPPLAGTTVAMSHRETVSADLRFHPPGPGTWRLLDDHFSRPLSRYHCTIDGGPMEEGFNGAAAEYGWLVEREAAIVNRFYYMANHAITPDSPRADASGITYDERVDRLGQAYEDRAWRRATEQWDAEWEPTIRAIGRELISAEPESLDDEALIDHLETAREITWDAHVYHFWMLPPVAMALGDFLASAADWTEREEGELLGLLDGSSPASAGLGDELGRVVSTFEDDPLAEAILFGDDPPRTIIDRLRARPGELGEAIERWLEIAGYRTVSGYDIADEYALERPDALVQTLRRAVREGVPTPDVGDDQALAELREEVPPGRRETFDTRLGEARAVWRARDETSLLSLWTQGLLRRGLLAAGRRLAERDRLHQPGHVVELTHEEVLAGLRDEPGPSPDEVERYVAYRQRYESDDAPDTLGPEPTPAVGSAEAGELPDPAARAVAAREAIQRAWTWGMTTDEPESDGIVDGLAASPGTVEATARTVTGPEDFSAIEDGDILVAELTSSAFNVVLPLLSGIVTDKGGMLSHPAIVAREFGIPAVVGCEDATVRIQDGQRIRIDGDAGTVRIVE